MSQRTDEVREALATSIRQRLRISNRPIVTLCGYCEARPDEFALLLSLIFWQVTSSVWQLLVVFMVAFFVLVFYFDVLRSTMRRWISQLPVIKTFLNSMVDLWTQHLPSDSPQITSASDLIIEKLSYGLASIKLAYGRVRTRQNEPFLIVGGILVITIVVVVWKYYILSLTMTVYWAVLFLLYWPRFQQYQVVSTLRSIVRFYREQLESSFMNRHNMEEEKQEGGTYDDITFAMSGELTDKAFDEVLGEELGYETHEVDQLAASDDDDNELRMLERGNSLYEPDVDEMPSIAVGDDDNSDDDWAFDADTMSQAEEMRFTSGLEFPSLSQDSIDYHSVPRRRMHRQRHHPRSRLADLSENEFPAMESPLSFVDEDVERERERRDVTSITSTPMEAAAEQAATFALLEDTHHLTTGHVESETHKVKRRQLPQMPQSRVKPEPFEREAANVDSIYTSKGLHSQPNSMSHSEVSQPDMSTRMRNTFSAPAAVLSKTSLYDWNFQENNLAADKSLNDKEKLDLTEFDIPDQSEIDSARQSASRSETPSRWLFG